MRFLSSFGRWLGKLSRSPHTAKLGALFLFVLAVGLLGPTHVTRAQQDVVSFVDTQFGNLVLVMAGVIQAITIFIAKQSLNIIEMIIVPILQYNSFSTSPTISLGWSLVRDVVNMFVVLVLLVIAIATIVGYEKVHWQKNLPQFLLAVILVNFSRTICGILIDFSQVVMFTFVNSLLAVGAGNFAQLLNFNVFGEYSNSAVRDGATGTSKAIDATQQLGAAYLLFVLYASIFAVLLLLALVYIWRIIMLWILVILSPLTFFTWGLGGMFKFAAGSSADWWKKFTAALTLGPMLTFFLWLALATGSGNIVETENFKPTGGVLSATLVSFETSNLLATFLGLCLLVVGMQQSAATANSMGGLAKKYLGDADGGQKLISRVARAPFQAGRAVGSEAFRQADRRLAPEGSSSFTLSKAGHLSDSAVANLGKVPLVGGVLGRTVANATGALTHPIEHDVLAGKKAAEKRVGQYTEEQLAQHVGLIADGHDSAFALNTNEDIEAIRVKALTDGDFRKKLKKHVGDEKYTKFMAGVVNMKDSEVKAAGGDLDKAAKGRSQNVHLMTDKVERDKLLQSEKFNPRDLSKEAASDKEVLEQLKSRVVRTNEKGEPVYAYDELIKGVYGKDLAEAAKGATAVNLYDRGSAAKNGGPSVADLKPEVRDEHGVVTEPARPYTAQEIGANISSKKVDPAALAPDDFKGPNNASLSAAVIDTGSIDKLSTATRDAFADALNRMPKGALSATQRAEADVALMKGGKSAVDIGLVAPNASTGGTLSPEMQLRIDQVIKSDTGSLRYLADVMPTNPTQATDVTAAVVKNVSADDINKLGEQASKASGKDLEDIRKTLKTIAASLAAEKANAIKGSADDKKLDRLYKSYRGAARYVA